MANNWTKAQHVEAGTWWDGEGDPPRSVLDARAKHGYNPDGSPSGRVEWVNVAYLGQVYCVDKAALRTPGQVDQVPAVGTLPPEPEESRRPQVGRRAATRKETTVTDPKPVVWADKTTAELRAEVERRNVERQAAGRDALVATGTGSELAARLSDNDAEQV